MAKSSGGTLHKGLTRKNPPQMAAGDPKTPTASIDSGATRDAVAKSHSLGPRTA